jgi:hypothetical protein
MLLASHIQPALWQIDQRTPLIFILINGYIARHDYGALTKEVAFIKARLAQ